MYGYLMAMSVAEVVGSRTRALRLDAGVTLDQFARAVKNYGLPWSTGRVGDFEGGRAAATLSTLFVVAAALGDVIGRPVPLIELFSGKGSVDVTDELRVDLSAVRASLSGEVVSVKPKKSSAVSPFGRVQDMLAASRVLLTFRESDERMCKNIGVSRETGATAMDELWGRPFSAERDHRAGPGANAQHRGQISRKLKPELMEELK
jgi:transcriptional regulator with XRE-family HTH domain